MTVNPKFKVHGEKGVGCGRYVRCTETLLPGELILEEDALVSGPKLSHMLVCVQCLRSLNSLSLCNSCGLPLCIKCQNQDFYDQSLHLTSHTQECKLLRSSGIKLDPANKTQAKLLLPCVTILRLLMQENWKHLESNLEMRKSSKSWNVVEKNVVPLLSEITDENENQLFTRDDIHLAAGVLDTNCFQVKSKEQFGRCIFSTAAMFNNNCSPNCDRSIVDNRIKIVAAREINVGEELTICYADTSLPTSTRQEIFETSKYFRCCCDRCKE